MIILTQERLSALTDRFSREPLARLFGMELEVLRQGAARVTMTATPDMSVVGGIVQGGITATLADYAGVYAAMSVIPEGHTPATHISIDYVRSVRIGEEVLATAEVRHQGGRSVVVEVTVHSWSKTDQDWDLRAVSLMTFAKPGRMRPRKETKDA